MPNSIAVTGDTGLATFSGMNLNLVSSDVFLKASTTAGKTACTTSGITVVTGSASTLTWVTPITTGQVTAGAVFSSQPTLVLKDSLGNVIQGKSITLTLYSDYTCSTVAVGTVTGSSINTDTSGVATFTAFKTEVAGTYYVKASGEGISSSCSGVGGALTVVSDVPNSFTFEQQPAGTVQAGLAFTTQAIIKVLDQYSNPVSGAIVTLAALDFTDNCGTGTPLTGTLGNGVVSTGINGLATFTTTYYDRAKEIKLRASVGGGK
jgi:hypothetical protein